MGGCGSTTHVGDPLALFVSTVVGFLLGPLVAPIKLFRCCVLPPVSISKAGGAFSGISPTVVDRGFGWYAVTLTASNTDTAGALVLHVEASGCDNTDQTFDVIPRNRASKLLA